MVKVMRVRVRWTERELNAVEATLSAQPLFEGRRAALDSVARALKTVSEGRPVGKKKKFLAFRSSHSPCPTPTESSTFLPVQASSTPNGLLISYASSAGVGPFVGGRAARTHMPFLGKGGWGGGDAGHFR
jgi:hypothetical protein